MPFALADRPSLALSLLKPGLERRGHESRVLYANADFARTLGLADYEVVARGLPARSLAGEWVFSESAFGESPVALEVFGRAARTRWPIAPEAFAVLGRARMLADGFVEEVSREVLLCGPDVVGFASSCPQNVAALAVARRVKALAPGTWIVFGGANWDGDVGLAQLELFPWVDFACLGEADESLPALVDLLAAGGPKDAGPPGVARRVDGRVVVAPGEWRPGDLDDLPLPDFGDFAGASGDAPGGPPQPGAAPLEGSRGCWWADRGACTFCGQNGTVTRYRAKSPARLLAELEAVSRAFPGSPVELTDNVVSSRFLREVLPRLAGTPLGRRLFFEVRPTLTQAEVELIAAVGARVQIGIESLSDNSLRLMHKGTRALENIRLLKWCRAAGVRPFWNFLFGVPGETDQDLAGMIDLIPAIRFLQAPAIFGVLDLDRFSRYFAAPGSFGLSGVRPSPMYGCVYPETDESIGRFAYAWDFTPSDSPVTRAYIFRLRSEIRRWRDGSAQGEPRFGTLDDGRRAIIDTRGDVESSAQPLDAADAYILDACADICTRRRLLRGWRREWGCSPDERLGLLADRRLVLATGDRYLSLVLPRETGGSAASAASTSRRSGCAPSCSKIP